MGLSELQNPGVPEGESVSGLIGRVRGVLRTFGHDLLLHGIVTGFRGTGFLELKDEKDDRLSISASYYGHEDVLAKLNEAGFPMQDGLPVMLRGHIGLSNARSQVRLMITGVMVEYTRAVLKSQRDATNERLQKEGLFERQKKLPFPLLPLVLGIVTSERGVVFEDLKKALVAAHFPFRHIWIRSSVQGAAAVRDVADAVTELGNHPLVDVICVFRGGGSAMELDAFNSYGIARAICECPKPVLCAIGHKNDECSAQDVAFRNCHTPSLLGEFLVSRIDGLRQRVSVWTEVIARRTRERHVSCQKDVQLLAGRCRERISALVQARRSSVVRLCDLVRFHSTSRIRIARQRVLDHSVAVPARCRMVFAKTRENLVRSRRWIASALNLCRVMRSQTEAHLAVIRATDPVGLLKRGFAIARREDGSIITRVAQLDLVPEALLQMQDGTRVISARKPTAETHAAG